MEAIKALKRARAKKVVPKPAARAKVPPEIKAEAEVAAPKKPSTRAKVVHTITVAVPPPPGGCVFNKDFGRGAHLYVIELPPQMQSVLYYHQKHTDKEEQYFVSWPRSLWFIVMKEAVSYYPRRVLRVHVVATLTPHAETKDDTKLFLLPMHNLGPSFRMISDLCLGCTVFPETKEGDNLSFINNVMVSLLSSKWNNGRVPYYGEVGIKSLADWHKKSKKNHEFHKELKLRAESIKTFGEAIKRFNAFATEGHYG